VSQNNSKGGRGRRGGGEGRGKKREGRGKKRGGKEEGEGRARGMTVGQTKKNLNGR